jgi:hypothetical protein
MKVMKALGLELTPVLAQNPAVQIPAESEDAA